jgi:NADH:ubiquinone oxidoreductase subunit 6 (subunit J)
MVLAATNPIYALLLLISVFFSSAILLLSFQVQFLALIYLIIYIGAIAILFLFVLMMFNIKHNKIQGEEPIKIFAVSFFIYNIIAARFVYFVVKGMEHYVDYNLYFNNYVVARTNDARYMLTYVYSDILVFSNLLYTYYDFLFLLSGLLLFVSMLGSIILALSTTETNIFNLIKK